MRTQIGFGYGKEVEDPYEKYKGKWVQINSKSNQNFYGLFKEIMGENIILSPFVDYIPKPLTEMSLLKIISKRGFDSEVPLESISRIAHSNLRWIEQLCINHNQALIKKEKDQRSK